MNIFMPEVSIVESIQALDDRRLNKQILECRQIIKANDRLDAGETKVGYSHHPVVRYYRDKRDFLIWYGLTAVAEYLYRKGKMHSYTSWFYEEAKNIDLRRLFTYDVIYVETNSSTNAKYAVDPKFDKSSEVRALFREKLKRKWDADRKRPTWTNRETPVWYKKEN